MAKWKDQKNEKLKQQRMVDYQTFFCETFIKF